MSDDDLSFPDRLESAAQVLGEGTDLVAFRSCPVRPPASPDPLFFDLLRDPEWCRRLRESVAARRTVSTRVRQLGDFLSCARRRGPAFLRLLARRPKEPDR